MKNKLMIATAVMAMSALFAQTPTPNPTTPDSAKTEKGKHKKMHNKKTPTTPNKM